MELFFNVSKSSVLPLILTGISAEGRKHTVCTSSICFSQRKNKVKAVLLKELVDIWKNLTEFSCFNVNPDFIVEAFETYKRGLDYFSQYLEIERII